jgi:hypothetical protein
MSEAKFYLLHHCDEKEFIAKYCSANDSHYVSQGTQFTCCASTNVQVLTPVELLPQALAAVTSDFAWEREKRGGEVEREGEGDANCRIS